ncbi:MAG: DegV family protein [Chloroflexi bacterium]|nr:DegV family protein [Chloroflexota bacterium]
MTAQDQNITLITDSTCDIPQELTEQYKIAIIPQTVVWGDEILRDRIDITPQQFYERIKTDPKMPTTTLPAPADFENAYRSAIENGSKEIIMLTVSSAMSGTFQLAKQVAEQINIPVRVVDSKGPTMSLGWQVLAAARARLGGANADQIIEAADKVRKRLVQIVCLDTLEFLYRGGRIGSATRLVGSLLDLKPLVQINHETGIVESSGRARTRKKSIEMLIQRFFEQIQPGKLLHVAVLHGNALDEAQQIAERIHKEFSPHELLINITGPVLGINTGPGALALCGYSEE